MKASYIPGQGLPIALPLGSSSMATSTQVGGSQRHLRGTNTAPSSTHAETATEPQRRLTAPALQRLDEGLPERDRQVLQLVSDHRYLTTNQLQRFAFTNHATEASAARTTRRVLARLERSRLLAALDRRIGGVRAGSAARVWQLTPGAARLLRADGAGYRRAEPSPRFMAHCLAVGDVHLTVRSLVPNAAVSVDVQLEPQSWRPYVGSGGERRSLQPDLAALVRSREYDDRWFIEVDLGTESLPTLLRKCEQYETYRASGIEQADSGVFPLVLWVLTRADRADRLQRSIALSRRLTPVLYRIATVDQVASVLAGAPS